MTEDRYPCTDEVRIKAVRRRDARGVQHHYIVAKAYMSVYSDDPESLKRLDGGGAVFSAEVERGCLESEAALVDRLMSRLFEIVRSIAPNMIGSLADAVEDITDGTSLGDAACEWAHSKLVPGDEIEDDE